MTYQEMTVKLIICKAEISLSIRPPPWWDVEGFCSCKKYAIQL